MTTTTHPARSRWARRRLAALGCGLAFATAVLAAGSASAADSASVANDTLTIRTGSGNDRLALRLAPGQAGTLQVDFGDDGSADQSFDRATFTQIQVSLASGNDQFRVDQVNGAFADEVLTVDGGSGSDTFAGGDAGEVFLGGSGNDAADGNRGDDVGDMGSGDDSFRWDPGDGSDVVEGRSGFDTLDFNGAAANEVMSLGPNGGRSLFLRDVANIRMDMDDVERLDLTALGGADSITVQDMSGTDFRQADIDLGGPDGAADTVVVNGTGGPDNIDVSANGAAVAVRGLQTSVNVLNPEPADTLRLNGLGGDDNIDVAGGVAALIAANVDLGADG